MTPSLVETIRSIVRDEMSAHRTAELAIVEETHPHESESDDDNYACTVKLRNDGTVLRRVPVATDRLGAASLPSGGDLVLVQFLGGDVNAPVIVGSLYNDEDRPPLNTSEKVVLHLPLDAGEDEAFRLEVNESDPRGALLTIGGALKLELRDDDPVVSLQVESGKATLEIAKDGAVTLKSDGALEITGQEVTIEATGGTLDLKGQTVDVSGSPTVNIN